MYETTVDFDYIQTDFQDLGEYAHYLQAVRKKSIYQTKTDVSTDDLILTLSTCDHVLAPKKRASRGTGKAKESLLEKERQTVEIFTCDLGGTRLDASPRRMQSGSTCRERKRARSAENKGFYRKNAVV